MRMLRIAVLTVAAVSLVLSVVATPRRSDAAPFSYSEGVSGDLGSNLPAPSVFAFDVGSNTVSGTLSVSAGLDNFDFDSFAFSVPSGAQLTNIGFTFSTTVVGNLMAAAPQFALDNGNAAAVLPFLASQAIDFLGSSPVSPFGGALPLGPGTYGLSQLTSQRLGFDSGWTTNYTWTFTVQSSPVSTAPEPTSLALLATGLGGMVVFLRRRMWSEPL
jgi:PEP-CTERM motif